MICALALVATTSMPARGLVYEGFSYAPELDLTTLASTATNLGNWTATAAIVGTTDAVGLVFGDLETSGGALRVTTPGANFNWQFLDAPVLAGGAIPDGSTVYGSYLFKFVGPGGGAGTGGFSTTNNFGISVGDVAGGTDITMQNRVRAYGSSPNVSRIGYEDENFGPMTSGDAIFDMTPYLFVGKWTNLGGASEATGWVLGAAHFDAISGDGEVTELELTNSNLATGTDVAGNTAGSFGVNQFVKIGDFIGAVDINYVVDEIRFADSLAAVLPVDEGTTFEGDFDGDGDVDGADLTGTPDGFNARFGVDLAGEDFLAWQRDFGNPAGGAAAVPEPAGATLAMLFVAAACLVPRKRRPTV
jgi:hypothetical protein